MLKKIIKGVWKIEELANAYYLSEENILIDTGFSLDPLAIKKELSKLVDLSKIKTVIFTHLHFDHIYNYNLFPNTKFYASKESIEDYNKNKEATVLQELVIDRIDFPQKEINLKLIDISMLKLPDYLKVIKTPGHTRSSISILDTKRKILFSRDTFFGDGIYGRTDLPTSVPKELNNSIAKIQNLEWDILCAGHDY